jgi:uncharacterized protein YraI
MFNRSFFKAAGIALPMLLALHGPSASAQAPAAFTTAAIWLRAGPALGFPTVELLMQDTPVTVYGCLTGWTWCDVSAGAVRGWAAAGQLAVPYGGVPRPIGSYGRLLGVPRVTFSQHEYWGRHYRERRWYHEHRWGHHRPPPRPAAPYQPQPAPAPEHPSKPPRPHGHGPQPDSPGSAPPRHGRPPGDAS